LNLASKGVLDNYGTKLLVKDVVKRFGYLKKNYDMSLSLRLKLVNNLNAHCEGIEKYFNSVYAR
jgi:hypothetical protein